MDVYIEFSEDIEHPQKVAQERDFGAEGNLWKPQVGAHFICKRGMMVEGSFLAQLYFFSRNVYQGIER
jgi:hypothetical protein